MTRPQTSLPTIPLRPRQRECLYFIERYQAAHGLAPSLEEIRVALGYRSKASVHRLLGALEAAGRILRLPGRARALMVVRETPWWYGRILVCDPAADESTTPRTLPLARWAEVATPKGDIEKTGDI